MNWERMEQNINGTVRRCVIIFYETLLAKELDVLLSCIAFENTLNLLIERFLRLICLKVF